MESRDENFSGPADRGETNDTASALPSSPPLTIAEMPLFPLDVVLFPSMPLPLLIFEERYKTMINRCVRESRPFGVVLATGVDEDGTVQTSDIGCTARIARVERLPDGKMNIEVVGENRFRILDTHERLPYRVGLTERVEDCPLTDDDAEEAAVLADEVSRLLREFLTRTLTQTGRSAALSFTLPDAPEPLSFLAASLLPVENTEKQNLLADDDAAARLEAERDHLRREVTRLRRAAEGQTLVWRPVELEQYDGFLCVN